ncbi:MAG: aspartate--tRNA ligase [Bacilli bacterium]
MKISHNNNELTIENVGEKVKLRGWVSKYRDLGGLLFIDLRDRNGITQLLIRPDNKFYSIANEIRNEFVIYVEGTVLERESKNKNMVTGDIEINVEYLEILNTALTPPMIIAEETDALEDTRMKYRYLDLRRPNISKYLKIRSQITHIIRDYFYQNDFIDIETPMLGKSTPEGARDYLVPSRLYEGEFYALPQSPQIYKQLLMVGGIERYYQITKCFRDEDLRADRQPEFTQLDIEMSFVDEEDIMELTNKLFIRLFKDILDIEFENEFPVITYEEAINKYGSDKPDTRFEMHLNDITSIFTDSEFMVFKNAINENNPIKCVVARNCSDKYSRKSVEKLEKKAKNYGASGLAWFKYLEGEFTGGISKFLTEDEQVKLIKQLELSENDIIFIVTSTPKIVADSLGFLRIELAKELDIIDDKIYKPLWVVDWPLFEYDEELGRYFAAHHPFTSPKKSDVELLSINPHKCLARAYDFVINGYEVGGGSIRIANQDLQSTMFKTLGFSEEEAYNQFGFFIDALKYGTPPHGGIAFGIDRISMIFGNTYNIKDVIAFPKTQSARCPMMDAPNTVSNEQLTDLSINIIKK